MKINRKLVNVLVIFMLLLPFRLPVSMILIDVLNYTASMGNYTIPDNVLIGNVLMTKLIYDVILSAFFVYNIEMLSRSILNRKALGDSFNGKRPESYCFWWTVVVGCILAVYIIYDGVTTYDIAEYFTIFGK